MPIEYTQDEPCITPEPFTQDEWIEAVLDFIDAVKSKLFSLGCSLWVRRTGS